MATAIRPRITAGVDPRTDAELLARFVAHHDPTAFTTLVHRHGPLVYGVCRRALGPTPDADDAFQATFLVLVQKAGAIPWRANVGAWLFGVAHRVSQKARFKRARRFAVEKQVDAMPHPETNPPDLAESDELSRAFDEELAALPEDMRRAVVLCELQGRSRQQAAKELRVSDGTLSSRLARARKMLRDRLAKRGFGLAVPGTVIVSAKLTAATVGLMTGLVNGSAGVVPAAVAALTQEAMRAMTISKLKLGAVLAAVAIGFTGYGLTASGGDEVKPPVKTAPLKANPAAVATIGGRDVSRDEFAEHLIRKYGAKEIEAFVNKKVIEAEAKKRGVSVSSAEVELAFLTDCKNANVTPADFVKSVLPRYGKTEAEWREDVLRPRLVLEKMCRGDVKVDEMDLRNLFTQKYGERRKVQVVQWSKELSETVVKNLYDRAKEKPWVFDQFATHIQRPGQPEERTITFDLGPDAEVYGGKAFKIALFNLKEVGEVSDLIETTHGWVAAKLVEVIPPQKDRKFEDERAALSAEVLPMKLAHESSQRFTKLKEDAQPVYHIQPERKTYPQPVPVKR